MFLHDRRIWLSACFVAGAVFNRNGMASRSVKDSSSMKLIALLHYALLRRAGHLRADVARRLLPSPKGPNLVDVFGNSDIRPPAIKHRAECPNKI